MIISMAAGYLQRAAGAIIRTVAFNLNRFCGVREITCHADIPQREREREREERERERERERDTDEPESLGRVLQIHIQPLTYTRPREILQKPFPLHAKTRNRKNEQTPRPDPQ